MIAVVVAGRTPSVRAGLTAMLGESGRLRVLGSVRALDDPAAAPLLDEADVALVDSAEAEPLADSIEIVEAAGIGLVVLGSGSLVQQMLAARPRVGWGLLPRDADAEQIEMALQAVASGLTVMGRESAEQMRALPVAPTGGLAVETVDDLTAREREVLALVALGLTNKAIAQRLAVSDHTVKFHVAAVLAKLGAESRTEAVNLGLRRGLLSL
ncbi:MAG: response regulator transcription factor [Chloroflexi bacterium]|nr:response regulator transcription factor [Chloroflexota bacterium]